MRRLNPQVLELEQRGEPLADDGRNIAPTLGTLVGEASQMRVERPDQAFPVPLEEAKTTDSTSPHDSYYGLPAIKEPVWRWYIPTYFYLGGLAGGSAWVGMCAALLDRKRYRKMITITRGISTLGLAGSAALLVADLGRPARFLNMLRVFRPTSPMNVGTWFIAAGGGASAAAWLSDMTGIARRTGDAAGVAAGFLGLAVSGYTAVLITNTAVPVWNGAYRTMPWLFIGSAMASAGSALELCPLDRRSHRAVRTLAVAGKVAELLGELLVEHETGRNERVGRPLRSGVSGALFRAARWGTAASVVASLLSPRSARIRVTAGLLGTAGAVAVRFAILLAGRASARDPLATFEPQRLAREKRERALRSQHLSRLREDG